MLTWLCGLVLGFSVIFGGGTHVGFLGDVVVQFLSVPLLAASLWSFSLEGEHKRRGIIFLGCGVVVVFAIQLLPLPFGVPSIGGALASRASVSGFLGQGRSWAPLSATPQATWAAAASLIVPASIFLGTLQLDLRHRLALAWMHLFLGGLSLILGFLQMAQGPSSSLRFYDVTNPKEAVGLFANRNHFAAHLYVTLVLAATWYATTVRQTLRIGALTSRSILWSTAAAVFLVSVVAGLAMARSRAGVFLALVALVGVVLMVLRKRKGFEDIPTHTRLTVARRSVLAVLFAILFAVQFGLGGVISRFEGDVLEDLRVPLARTTFEAALRSLPFGAGVGSFVPVYAVVENDNDIFAGYANRAHNDLAEILLETGLFGLVLLLAFMAWFFRKTYDVWFMRKFNGHDSQLLLQRAATLIIFLLLAHSLVDYPLRTTALSSIFVFFCAVLTTQAQDSEDEKIPDRRQRFVGPKPTLRVTAGETWGSDLRWPEGWQRRS